MCSYSSVFSFPPKLTMAQLRHLEIGIDATADAASGSKECWNIPSNYALYALHICII